MMLDGNSGTVWEAIFTATGQINLERAVRTIFQPGEMFANRQALRRLR